MNIVRALALGLAMWMFNQDAQSIVRPEPIRRCLNNPTVSALVVLYDINPFYLRGDFDGDGRPDHAIQARLPSKGGSGVVVCSSNGTVFLLGSGIGGKAFSDKPDDRFLARHWEVFTPQDVRGLRAFTQNVPRPVRSVASESIAMVWEDGIGLIYWDGKRFRWAGPRVDACPRAVYEDAAHLVSPPARSAAVRGVVSSPPGV